MLSIREIWKKYIGGKASKEDKKALVRAIENKDADLDTLLYGHWKDAKERPIADEELQRAKHQLFAELQLDTKKTKSYSRLGIAASIAALVAVSIFAYLQLSMNDRMELSVAYGEQIKEVILPDGTKVWINNGSSISYPKEFEVTERRVKVLGNAFFDVTRDTLKPFVIETGKLNIKVLGTAFDVYCYENEPSKVTVAHGKVEVSHTGSNSKVTLMKNEQSLFDRGLEKMVKVTTDSDKSTSWRNNILSFENLEFVTVIKKIERKFDVKINCQDSTLLATRIRASYQNEPLDTILSDLAFMINFDYNQNETNNEITLKPLVYEQIE